MDERDAPHPRVRRGVHNTTTYVGHEGEVDQPSTIEFNHGLAEIITAVMS